MAKIELIGADWLADRVGSLTDSLTHVTPAQYNEQTRYLPASVTSQPGYIRYAVNPYMREIVDCFDINSPVREVSVKKGAQITYSTLLESGILYFADYVGTLPIMYMTADKELAESRIENNIIPMFVQSDLGDILQTSDTGNSRKTGKTKQQLQFAKGGYLVPFGARNADKMRSYSIAVLLKDEIDAWPDVVGKDGDPDALSDARTDGYTASAKIFRGSTPLFEGTSKIQKNFLKGDQRVYRVLCKSCGFPQALRWRAKDGEKGGFAWDLEDGTLVLESVRYKCVNCEREHYEHDKARLFAEEHGAHWHPTARPADPNIRSYHLPALYSPVGFRPWWKCAAQWEEAFDTDRGQTKDVGKLQVFYNNVLAEPFAVKGARIQFEHASAHRRPTYTLGTIPNVYATQYCGSPVLLVTCQVDVHGHNLAVSTMGWTKDARCFVIDYWRFDVAEGQERCEELGSPVWQRLRTLLEETIYEADDGKTYPITLTLVDSGYAQDTVLAFCAEYDHGVYPIKGTDRPAKGQSLHEFAEFTTKAGTVGYSVTVDHYKDRLAPVLRREWHEEDGEQRRYHFNAPANLHDDVMRELTVETRVKKTHPNGRETWSWDRPSHKRNELWDLLVYGHAAVEIMAWAVCIQHFELDTVDWAQFWQYIEQEQLYFSQGVSRVT